MDAPMPLGQVSPDVLPLQIVAVAWLVVLGTVFGSFMNVVVYRLPRGLNLALPASHCPRCKSPIRWFDNVPVVSWIVLGGRCRDCGQAISPVYLLVEAVTGAVFGLVGWTDLVSRIVVPADASPGAEAPLPWSAPVVLAAAILTGLHLLLVCTFFVAAMIETGSLQQVPARLFWPLAAVGTAVWLAWPMLREHVAGLEPLATPPENVAAGVLAIVVGGAAWFAAARWLGLFPSLPGQLPLANRPIGSLVLAGACLGVCLGWRAAAAIPILMFALHAVWTTCISKRTRPFGLPWTGWAAVLALAWILAGHRLFAW